jgi:spermidine/putrescine transport system substrate-binding protein
MSASNGEPDLRRMQEILRRRLTRRGFIRGAGVGVAGISLGSLLAACGEQTTSGGGGAVEPTDVFGGAPEGHVEWANWPVYIDKAKDAETGERYSPSLRAFEEHTGTTVNYAEVIQENASFFGKIQPQLAAGQETGWDIIVMTNGWEFQALVVNNWVSPLDTTKRPTFDAHAIDWAKNPPFDEGAKHSMTYQSGITGIGVNRELVTADISTLDDLADTTKLPPKSVGMLKADMADFVMINLGIDPETSGPAEWQEAADWLQMQRDSGVVRQYYEQNYADDLTAGNLAATMAWSGDVFYYAEWGGYPNLEFVFPEGGAYMWADNLMIPAGAANPVSAMSLMDYYYDPVPATMVQEWVFYMSPVEGTRDLILQHAAEAEEAGDQGYANKLTGTANNEYLFPSDELLARTSFGRQLTTDEEKAEWDSIFLPISE